MQIPESQIKDLQKVVEVLTDKNLIEKIDKFNENIEKFSELEAKRQSDIDWAVENLILDAKDLMRITGLNQHIIYSWFHRKDFPSMQFSNRRYVITKEAFRKWLSQQVE